MNDPGSTKLVGLIYDFAEDAELWPQLLKELAQVVERNVTETNRISVDTIDSVRRIVSNYYGDENDGTFLEDRNQTGLVPDSFSQFLVSHLRRALKVSNRIADSDQYVPATNLFLDRIPLGVAEVDAKGYLIACNQSMSEIIGETPTITLSEGILTAVKPKEKERFASLISQVAENVGAQYESGVAIRLLGPVAESSLSAVMLPHDNAGSSHHVNRKHAMILVAIPNKRYEIHIENLQNLYAITRTEAQVVRALVNGKSVRDIAIDLTKREDTVRKQLKSVLRKTGTSGQAALIKLVVTGPAVVSFRPRQSNRSSQISGIGNKDTNGDKSYDARIRLSDGRWLGFAEYGVQNGDPVIYMHGLGGRLQVPPDKSIFKKLGIRLLVPERPGYGFSDFKSNRTILEWADDVVALANYFGVNQFAVLGFSIGGIYALACGYRFPNRISRIVLSSCMGPYTKLSDLRGMLSRNRMSLTLGRYAPALLVPFMEMMANSIRQDPDRFFREFIKHESEGYKSYLSDPIVKASIINAYKESIKQGVRGMVYDVLLISRDWDFLPGEVRVPVHLWHGMDNKDIPLHMANALSRSLPICTKEIVRDAGHYLLYQYWERVLASTKEENCGKGLPG